VRFGHELNILSHKFDGNVHTHTHTQTHTEPPLKGFVISTELKYHMSDVI